MNFKKYTKKYPKQCQGCKIIPAKHSTTEDFVIIKDLSVPELDYEVVVLYADIEYCNEEQYKTCPCVNCLVKINCSERCMSFKESFFKRISDINHKNNRT